MEPGPSCHANSPMEPPHRIAAREKWSTPRPETPRRNPAQGVSSAMRWRNMRRPLAAHGTYAGANRAVAFSHASVETGAHVQSGLLRSTKARRGLAIGEIYEGTPGG